jgi:hypothetical protein
METRVQVWRRWKRGLLLIAVIYAAWVGYAFGWLFYKSAVHRRWQEHVKVLILQLAPKRPADVTPEQWAHCLQWTWNLHANYGGQSYFPEAEREPFALEFERLVEGPVRLDTIDKIWDSYVRHAPRAKPYMHFRPTTGEMFKQASVHSLEWLNWELENLGGSP